MKSLDKKKTKELYKTIMETLLEQFHCKGGKTLNGEDVYLMTKSDIDNLLTQQRTELNREWNSKLLLSQREMINSFKNKDEGVKNWEDEYFRRYQDGLWSDADSLAVDKSSEVKEFIKETVMEIRTELLEEYFEKEDNLIDKHANLKDDNWDKFLEARSKLKINLLNKKDE